MRSRKPGAIFTGQRHGGNLLVGMGAGGGESGLMAQLASDHNEVLGLERRHQADTVRRAMSVQVHAVVIAGGSGTRFWPLSRRSRPKQLLTLGVDVPLIAATFERVSSVVEPDRWWMVVGATHHEACHAAVARVPRSHVLVEPQARNTAPAIGLAALHLQSRDPDAIMVVLPADHHVADVAAFAKALNTAAELASQGPIVTLGIAATRPETGYGYIQRGAADARAQGCYRVLRFREKPKLETARGFLAQGGFDWNAGIFVMRAASVLHEIKRQLPKVHEALESIRDAIGSPRYDAVLRAAYEGIQPVSIDYGVMEGAEDVSVLPVACGWSDVGSFDALDALLPRDAAGNVVSGRCVSIDTRDCLLYAGSGQVIAAVGVSGLAVVQTPDATLVVPLNRAQDVKSVLAELGDKGWTEYL